MLSSLRRLNRPQLKIRLIALLCGMLLALAACGGGSDSGKKGSDDSSGAKISGDINVFAAASLTESFTELGKKFEDAHPGTKVIFNFAASSALAQQINSGAPADVFASASSSTMKQVTDADNADGEPVVFVRNLLEIAVPKDNPAKVTGLADFAKSNLKIALCAKEVPCGAAALKAFKAADITPKPDTLEQDVKATLTKVELGEVDAALVYRTDVKAAGDKVQGIEFPESEEAVNDYPIVTLSKAPNTDGATAFVKFILSSTGQQVLSAAGFAGAK